MYQYKKSINSMQAAGLSQEGYWGELSQPPSPPVLGRTINPISTQGGRLCPPQYYKPPQIFRPCDGPALKGKQRNDNHIGTCFSIQIVKKYYYGLKWCKTQRICDQFPTFLHCFAFLDLHNLCWKICVRKAFTYFEFGTPGNKHYTVAMNELLCLKNAGA